MNAANTPTPAVSGNGPAPVEPPLLEVKQLRKSFPVKAGIFRREVSRLHVVNDVNFTLAPGETLGIVGESGCGKTTTVRSVIRLIEPDSGEVYFQNGDERVDLLSLGRGELRRLRHRIQYVFQDPFSSLNPWMSVQEIISEPLRVNKLCPPSERGERVAELLQQVGLKPSYMTRYPHEFSGGQRQRIGIARALATRPALIIADEPVSALDVSVQAQILNLLRDLGAGSRLSFIFISHDLGVVEYICDRVGIMYLGEFVELAPSEELFAKPLHPYTATLLAARPKPDPKKRRSRMPILGEIPDLGNPPSGCKFHPRCPFAKDICRRENPKLEEYKPGHFSRCHFSGELDL